MSLEPLVVSFYTENTPYQLEALSLRASCLQFGIDVEIEGVESLGSWERNCARKPFFIQQKLLEKKRPIFWVDADAIFRKVPNFSFLKSCDFAIREMKRFSNDRRFKYFSGSLFFNYTPLALEFVDKWCEHCRQKVDRNQDLSFLDQISILDLMERGQPLTVFPLPISYAKVFDIDALEIGQEEVVIEHFQASRRFRHWNI